MVVFKYICFVIAVIATCFYINNLVVDLSRITTWQNYYHTDEENKESQKDADRYASFRFILSIIMGLTWGVVVIL